MEWLALTLTGFLMLVSPVNWIGDRLIADQIRQRVHRVEELAVRVDNAPNFQVLQGRVDRVRIAAQGLEIISGVRVEKVQLETDPIALRWRSLKGGNLSQLRQALDQPLQGAMALTVTEQDINQALAAPEFKNRLINLVNGRLPGDMPKFTLETATVDLLPNDRVMVQVKMQQGVNDLGEPETLQVDVAAGVQVLEGNRLGLKEPEIRLNGRKVSSRIVASLLENYAERLSLQPLEKQGITARILSYDLNGDRLEMSIFGQLRPLETPEGNSTTLPR